mgnify:FL=1
MRVAGVFRWRLWIRALASLVKDVVNVVGGFGCAEEKRQREEQDEHIEEYLGDAARRDGYSRESEDAGYDREDEKGE